MEPVLHKGDVVVVERTNNNYADIEVGDIIAVKNEGITYDNFQVHQH